MNIMKKYELVVMFPTDRNDVSAEKDIGDRCKKHEVKIVTLDKWGVKTMAYPIKKQTKAYYLKYDLESGPVEIKKLENDLKLDESILRYLLVINRGRTSKDERQKSK